MHEPWLFWTGVALAAVAGICFILAVRIHPKPASLTMEISILLMAGISGLFMGYEIAFHTFAKNTLALKTNTAVGGVLLGGGLMLVVNAVVKAFGK